MATLCLNAAHVLISWMLSWEIYICSGNQCQLTGANTMLYLPPITWLYGSCVLFVIDLDSVFISGGVPCSFNTITVITNSCYLRCMRSYCSPITENHRHTLFWKFCTTLSPGTIQACSQDFQRGGLIFGPRRGGGVGPPPDPPPPATGQPSLCVTVLQNHARLTTRAHYLISSILESLEPVLSAAGFDDLCMTTRMTLLINQTILAAPS